MSINITDPGVLALQYELQRVGISADTVTQSGAIDLDTYVPSCRVSIPLKSGQNYATLTPDAMRLYWAEQEKLGFYPDFPIERSWAVTDRLAMQRLLDARIVHSSGHVVLDDKDNGETVPVYFTNITRKLLNLCLDVKRVKATNGLVSYYIDIFGTYPIDKNVENTHEICLNRAIYDKFSPAVSRNGIVMRNLSTVTITDAGRIVLTGINPSDFAIMLWDSMREINPTHMSFTVEIVGKFIPYGCVSWLLLQEKRQNAAIERKAYRDRVRGRFTSGLQTTNQQRQARKDIQLQKLRISGDLAMFNMVAAQPLHTF